jgi:hypothetical protein
MLGQPTLARALPRSCVQATALGYYGAPRFNRRSCSQSRITAPKTHSPAMATLGQRALTNITLPLPPTSSVTNRKAGMETLRWHCIQVATRWLCVSFDSRLTYPNGEPHCKVSKGKKRHGVTLPAYRANGLPPANYREIMAACAQSAIMSHLEL